MGPGQSPVVFLLLRRSLRASEIRAKLLAGVGLQEDITVMVDRVWRGPGSFDVSIAIRGPPQISKTERVRSVDAGLKGCLWVLQRRCRVLSMPTTIQKNIPITHHQIHPLSETRVVDLGFRTRVETRPVGFRAHKVGSELPYRLHGRYHCASSGRDRQHRRRRACNSRKIAVSVDR